MNKAKAMLAGKQAFTDTVYLLDRIKRAKDSGSDVDYVEVAAALQEQLIDTANALHDLFVSMEKGGKS